MKDAMGLLAAWFGILAGTEFAGAQPGLRRPVNLRFARDGGLYVLLRNAWVIDDKFTRRTGSLLQIRPVRSP